MKDLVVVKVFESRVEAEVAKGFLEVNDIPSFVTADDEGGMYPFPMSPTTSGVKLFVAEKDYKKASSLLK
jgi:hypothetical protein